MMLQESIVALAGIRPFIRLKVSRYMVSKFFLPLLLLAGLLPQTLRAGDFLDRLFSCSSENCPFGSDERLLAPLQNRSLTEDFSFSVGGALRYRTIDEKNRLRPPLKAGQSNYDQWRFTPFLQLNYKDLASVFVQAIDAPTFGNELPLLFVNENRADLLRYYLDLNLLEIGEGELHFRYGRQFLNYGSQHVLSSLAWVNTYRNFEGSKLFYHSPTWDIDAFAVQPVNGASLNKFRPTSYDTPDQSRWVNGVYASYKNAPGGVVDLYWIWLREKEDRLALIDGNRHTLGMRYAGKHAMNAGAASAMVWNWDLEGVYQFGKENFLTGLNQDIQAGFFSAQTGPTFSSLPWSPAVTGIFWWGSGDQNPNDGKSQTVNTLFPLAHAYWGQIDNFDGQNLLDYGLHLTLKPAKKWSVLTGLHWFNKASRTDAIYNVAGVPFGGVSTTPANLGNELDLVATYQVNKNLQLQAGFFKFWYGNAVSQNPNALVANRGDADFYYFLADWAF